MRREEERAEILDRCLERMRLGEDPERVLEEHPEAAEEIRPLLVLAEELASRPAPAPAGEGLVRSLIRMAADPAARPARPRRARGGLLNLRVWARAAVLVLAVFLAGWGAVSASANAVAGDILYPVKRFAENVRFFLTVSPDEKAELRISFSAERLREAVRKMQRGEGVDEDLLREMLEEARKAMDGIERMPAGSREILALRAAHLSDYQRETLDRLRARGGEREEKVLRSYRDLCGRRGSWMREVLSGGRGPGPDGARPGNGNRLRRWRERCPGRPGGCR